MIRGGLPYCRGRRKRALDLVLAAPALLLLAPLLLLIAVAVRVSMGPPVLFRHERIGRDGRPFRLLKFRSMRPSPPDSAAITSAGDPRITPAGRLLRRTKLDELPQLFNVIRGEMSLVGPRPEVPRYVQRYTPEQRRVLDVPPGLTDPASLCYRDEEAILGRVREADRERYYVEELAPRKIALSLAYITEAGIGADLKVMLRTGLAVLGLSPR
ncbi:MAG TPA: sugar transferase [Dongiaceae bacterium]|nr:sugar transferase [Dongiaceae bacterium]